MKKWIVVADAGRARFFEQSGRDELVERKDLLMPEARLLERDLTSDRSGRDSGSDGGYHAVDSSSSTKDEDALRFARQIAAELDSISQQGVDGFVLIAAPRLLGKLRPLLSKAVVKRVVREIDQDLTLHTESEILSRLKDPPKG